MSKRHYLTPGAGLTDCGVKAFRHDVVRGTAQSEYGNQMFVTREEERVDCKSCRRAFVHRGIDTTPVSAEASRE
jgi:hypothetical protein